MRVSADVVHDMIRAGGDSVDEICEISGWPVANVKAAVTQLGFTLDEDDKPVRRPRPAPGRPQVVRQPDHDKVAAQRQVDQVHRQAEEDAVAIAKQRAAELDKVAPPRVGLPGPRPTPLVNVPTPLETLLVRGQQSTSKRTKAIADRIDDLCTELTGRLKDEERAARQAREQAEAKAKAKAEVERLKKELADAQARLRPARERSAPKPKPAPKPPGNPLPPVPGESTPKVRAWALDNGHEVGAVGRIPALVVLAYRQAHQAAASA